MADSAYTKSVINSVYSKLNTISNARCKTRFQDDQTEYQMCSHQAMSDNARILITRLRGQIGGCAKSTNPEKCTITITKLIRYLEGKQDQHEQHVDQLRNLEG